MFARSARSFTFLAVYALIGCGDKTLTDPVPLDDAGHGWDLVSAAKPGAPTPTIMVPIKWDYRMQPAGPEILWCTAPDGNPFMPIPVRYAASGRMSHLGELNPFLSRAWFDGCVISFGPAGPTEGTAWGGVELVGANGDAIALEGSLTLSFASGVAVGDWAITGGTGRFDGARGWIETAETPAEGGSGSAGSGAGLITPPGIAR